MTSAKTLVMSCFLVALILTSSASASPLFGLFNKPSGGPGGQFGGPPPMRAYNGFGQGGGGFGQGGFGQGGFGQGGPGGSRFG